MHIHFLCLSFSHKINSKFKFHSLCKRTSNEKYTFGMTAKYIFFNKILVMLVFSIQDIALYAR